MAKANIWQWSETAGSNTEINGNSLAENVMLPSGVNNSFREMMAQIITTEGKGTDIASAATLTLSGPERYFHITGSTGPITDIDFTDAVDGRWAWLIFDSTPTITHNATTLQLPGAASIVAAAGDRALFVQDSSDNVICLAYVAAAVLNTQSGQYNFPATQNASTGANVLDDYEEGTWTINMTFNASPTGVTYSANTGSYIKVGKKVTVFGRITLTSNGTGVGVARITNLPFTSDNIGASVPGSLRLLAGGSAASGLYPSVENSTTTAVLYIPGAASDAQATDTNITDTFSADFSMTYQASA